MPSDTRAVLRAAFPIAAVLVTGVFAYFAFLPEHAGTTAFWALAGAPTLALAALAVAWGRREGLLRDWLVPKWGDFSLGLAGAAALFAIFWALARVVTPFGSPRAIWLVSLYGQIGDLRVLQAHAPAVAVTIVAVTIAEEVVWRGMVTQLLADRVGSRAAWIWAAAFYALAYVPTIVGLGAAHGLNPVLAVGALFGALVWGGLARFSGRLGPSIVAHALFDWAVVMMFPLSGPAAWMSGQV